MAYSTEQRSSMASVKNSWKRRINNSYNMMCTHTHTYTSTAKLGRIKFSISMQGNVTFLLPNTIKVL